MERTLYKLKAIEKGGGGVGTGAGGVPTGAGGVPAGSSGVPAGVEGVPTGVEGFPADVGVLFVATNVLFVATNVLFVMTNVLFVMTNDLFVAANVLFVMTNVLFVATNVLFVATNGLFVATNGLFVAANGLFVAANGLFVATNDSPAVVGAAPTAPLGWASAVKAERSSRDVHTTRFASLEKGKLILHSEEPKERMERMEQKHLGYKDTVNLGSYYTPAWLVDAVYALIQKNVPDSAACRVVDTSCGYGGFLRGERAIGADIDDKAVEAAKGANPAYDYFNHNSLFEIARSQYNLGPNEKIIIVGNPPYNDATSIIRSAIKKAHHLRDADVRRRDVGISFLLSYDKLAADFVCVLHPLSYLIKKANFEALTPFKDNYRLMDSVVISSRVFQATSKTTSFPIVIALYERDACGMDYDCIKNYPFKTNEGKTFSIKAFDAIGNYISKYPNHKQVSERETVAYFYTMRDINALKRTATFLAKETGNAVRVTQSTLPYYCYVDVFKDYIPHIPYYFGNSDIMIEDARFHELEPLFMSRSARKHPKLGQFVDAKSYNDAEAEVSGYFRRLLGEHYVD
jgi:hypothetical protein